MTKQSNPSPDGNVNTGSGATPSGGAVGSRRRFIKGGAAAAPVILTFTSRPVLGFEQACLTPSRMISGNHSGLTGVLPCGGNTRAYWAEQTNLVGNQKPPWVDYFFTTVFGPDYPYDSRFPGDPNKLGAVLLDSIAEGDKNANSVAGFASYIIAAYLNAGGVPDAVGISPSVVAVLKPAQVKHMWNDVIGTGKFYAQETMHWDANGVIGYLTNSGIVPA